MSPCATACLLIGLLSASSLAAQESDDWEIERLRWSAPAAARAAIEIDNPHGDVRCRQAPGDELAITAIVQRHRLDPYRARLEVDEGEGLRIEVAWGASEESAGGEYVEGIERRRVDLMVLVPAGPRLVVRTAAGLLEAKGTANDVEATTDSGDVTLSIYGSAVAVSDRGALDVTLRRADWGEPARLETRTGPITVWLPPEAEATLEAATEGILSTDYSLEVDLDEGGRRKTARAVLGDGERRLAATSIKGDIRLFRLPG